ncbi:MAG: tetratricopeptide repeat protein [Candidatus Promineifilaceae bacterium]|nr:tetratricopeptide repeat protein [Candidatus Promineifilaceae bacterium]
MSDEIQRQQAMILFERAYRHQMQGEFADAIILYKRSLQTLPTAEAHTFLGWTYSMLERYEEAIAACKEAIAVDPTFGNPYNDIGAYLIELDRWEEAIPWLEKATQATRYEAPQFPLHNLGRVYEHLGQHWRALDYYDRALALDPLYHAALAAKYALLGALN